MVPPEQIDPLEVKPLKDIAGQCTRFVFHGEVAQMIDHGLHVAGLIPHLHDMLDMRFSICNPAIRENRRMSVIQVQVRYDKSIVQIGNSVFGKHGPIL